MTETQTVLLLGSSNVSFTDTETDTSLTTLVRSQLEERIPDIDWRCEGRPIHYGRRMAEMAERHTKAIRPAAVILSLVQAPFAANVPIAVIRRRWPRLYPVARFIAERLRLAAGGVQVNSIRGLLFQAPRWLLVRLIGAEPEVPLEDAIRYTKDALDALVRIEEPLVFCGMGFTPSAPPNTPRRIYEYRLSTFRREVLQHCRLRHVETYDRNSAAAAAGRKLARSFDERYADLQTRSFQAQLIADLVTASIAGQRAAQVAVTS